MTIKALPILIYGASGFGRELAWLIESCAEKAVHYELGCFIDDESSKHGTLVNGIRVVSFEDATQEYPGAAVAAGIGNPQLREKLVAKSAEAGFKFATIVYPSVERSHWIEIGKGTVICAGCILTTNIRLGKHVQINLNCTIGHDVVMGDFTTLAPGVHVSGWVHLGKRVYVGTGATIINGTEEKPLTIGDDAVIGAGAVVTKPVPSGETWGGYRPKPCIADSDPTERFSNWNYPEIEEGKLTRYNWLVQHKENLVLGYKTDIGAFTYINAKYDVVLEDYVQIGSHCSIYSFSTIDDKMGQVLIKRNARIGSHTVIMPGVTVGENAVVGAHSFVNKDVAANAVVAGVPARQLRLKQGA